MDGDARVYFMHPCHFTSEKTDIFRGWVPMQTEDLEQNSTITTFNFYIFPSPLNMF